ALPTNAPAATLTLAGASLCNDAELDRENPPQSVGDPTAHPSEYAFGYSARNVRRTLRRLHSLRR
ncbi:MAG TPA: hypothetical protein VLR47_08320, partial [Rhodospirillales bacterium]|nr:hypothetical protein [Rhodospirillales bacterium]